VVQPLPSAHCDLPAAGFSALPSAVSFDVESRSPVLAKIV